MLSMLALMLSDKYSKRSRFLEILNGLNEFSSKIEETLKLDEQVKKIAQTWTRISFSFEVSLLKKLPSVGALRPNLNKKKIRPHISFLIKAF